MRTRIGHLVTARLSQSLPAGRSALALPHHLGAREYLVALSARTAAGAVAVDELGIMGRRRLTLAAAREPTTGCVDAADQRFVLDPH